MHRRVVPCSSGDNLLGATITIGTVSTGKTRVFAGYYCTMDCNGLMLIKEHTSDLHICLLSVINDLAILGYTLNLYGQAEFTLTGLSYNTGYGYVPFIRGPVLMIDAVVSE